MKGFSRLELDQLKSVCVRAIGVIEEMERDLDEVAATELSGVPAPAEAETVGGTVKEVPAASVEPPKDGKICYVCGRVVTERPDSICARCAAAEGVGT